MPKSKPAAKSEEEPQPAVATDAPKTAKPAGKGKVESAVPAVSALRT